MPGKQQSAPEAAPANGRAKPPKHPASAGSSNASKRAWSELLAAGRQDGRLVGEAYNAKGKAKLHSPASELHPELLAALRKCEIEQLYSHQAQAVDAAWDHHVIVTSGTASGKSLCFNLPTLNVLCDDRRARALYLYPTKALAQDQARALAAFGLGKLVRPAIYDGDTPRQARTAIRRNANIVLSNPDMLHVGILPHHEAWADLFSNLAIVVIDEAHVYRGVFGSHVANVLRRLLRVANAYGTTPRFLLASATIGNPHQLAQRLTGLQDIDVIDTDGSPTPSRQIALWNPPLIDERLGTRLSAVAEASELLSKLVSEGAKCICFVRSRKGVELLAKLVKDRLRAQAPELAKLVVPYRAGYTPQQRREIEAQLVAGTLRAVISTDALELGIDIGELDAAIVVNFPGTVASLRQMWGRAGRRGEGLALYIAGEDALDQYFCRHPDHLLQRPVEEAILDHESLQIHLSHLLCAAYEGPLCQADAQFLGPRWEAYAEMLVRAGALRKREHATRGALRRAAYVPRHPGSYPAGEVSLRSTSADRFIIAKRKDGELLGSTEAARAYSTIHEGAIYLHQGVAYEVCELDLDRRRAFVDDFDGDWYTQPKTETDLVIERLLDRKQALGVSLSFGSVRVSETVIAYQRKRISDHSAIDLITLDLPETSFETQAIWFEPQAACEQLPLQALLGALHATEHAQIAVLPLIAMCDRWDIGGLSTNLHPQTGGPTIFIYDGHPGGVGITQTAFHRFEELCADASRLISGCPCKRGCPSCVQSPKCGNLNEPLSKAGASMLLEALLAQREQPRAPSAGAAA